MRDDDARGRGLQDRAHDDGLRRVVQRTRGLVEQEDRRIPDDRRGNHHPLPLATTESQAAVTDRGVQTKRQSSEIVCESRALDDRSESVIVELAGTADAIADRGTERMRGLQDDPHLPAHRRDVDGGEVRSVVGDHARPGLLESEQQADQGRLPAAGRPDERDELPGLNGERHAGEQRCAIPAVAEVHIVEGNRASEGRRWCAVELGRAGENRLDARELRAVLREVQEVAGERDHRDRHLREGGVHGEERPGRARRAGTHCAAGKEHDGHDECGQHGGRSGNLDGGAERHRAQSGAHRLRARLLRTGPARQRTILCRPRPPGHDVGEDRQEQRIRLAASIEQRQQEPAPVHMDGDGRRENGGDGAGGDECGGGIDGDQVADADETEDGRQHQGDDGIVDPPARRVDGQRAVGDVTYGPGCEESRLQPQHPCRDASPQGEVHAIEDAHHDPPALQREQRQPDARERKGPQQDEQQIQAAQRQGCSEHGPRGDRQHQRTEAGHDGEGDQLPQCGPLSAQRP